MYGGLAMCEQVHPLVKIYNTQDSAWKHEKENFTASLEVTGNKALFVFTPKSGIVAGKHSLHEHATGMWVDTGKDFYVGQVTMLLNEVKVAAKSWDTPLISTNDPFSITVKSNLNIVPVFLCNDGNYYSSSSDTGVLSLYTL